MTSKEDKLKDIHTKMHNSTRKTKDKEVPWMHEAEIAAVQPQQSPGGPKGAMRRQRMEIRQLHSSEAGEALIRLLQIQVDFYIFFSGID